MQAFRKTGPASALPAFEAEADGLRALRETGAVRVPEVLDCGIDGGESFLLLERLPLTRPDKRVERLFGEQLATLHRHSDSHFGWFRDNTIGPTPQVNTRSEDWLAFFREHRLGAQLRLAAHNGFDGELQALGAELAQDLLPLFADYAPAPSLLHGDLWAGNWGAADGVPVTFDPAVHYGDRECDLAMSRLFGGFGPDFYAAYTASWPLADGHEQRLWLYQLYHVLNHLNLFGRSYYGQALDLLRKLCGFIAGTR